MSCICIKVQINNYFITICSQIIILFDGVLPLLKVKSRIYELKTSDSSRQCRQLIVNSGRHLKQTRIYFGFPENWMRLCSLYKRVKSVLNRWRHPYSTMRPRYKIECSQTNLRTNKPYLSTLPFYHKFGFFLVFSYFQILIIWISQNGRNDDFKLPICSIW
jgi:hypothetical protein